MAKFSTDDSPGGDHHVNVYSDPTLALSEGWATFFAGAALDLDYYFDTDDSGKVGTMYSLETLCGKGEKCDKTDGGLTFELGTGDDKLTGKICEAAVTAVLWDYFDNTQETKDTLKNRSESIWSVMTDYLKKRANGVEFCDRGVPERDLVDFIDGWQWLSGTEDLGTTDAEGLRGAAIGLMELPKDVVLTPLPSCSQ